MSTWTKRERLSAALSGERPDHPPVSAYRHTRGAERTADDLVAATLAFQQQWDWDWIKLNPRTVHYAEAWGNVYDFEHYPGPLPIPAQVYAAVAEPADTWALERLDIDAVPVFQEQLEGVNGDHDDPTNPGIDTALAKTKFAGVSHSLLGGAADAALLDAVHRQVESARALLDDRFVLAPTCSVPEHTSDAALRALRDAAAA